MTSIVIGLSLASSSVLDLKTLKVGFFLNMFNKRLQNRLVSRWMETYHLVRELKIEVFFSPCNNFSIDNMYSSPIGSSTRRKPAATYGGYVGSGVGDKIDQKPKTSIKERVTKIADTATAMRYRVVKKDYFKSSKRGEIHEWKQLLNDENELVRKETLKKIIAGMTTGKEVNELFPHVLKCIYTKDLEMKKLVYQYLVNYSANNPELAVLAINSFCKDCEDKNPTVRALALRTMASIRVDCISEYLLDPLRSAFKDDNPFVRRTAVTAVAKFFETLPELAQEFDLEKTLQKMLTTEINSGVAAAIISSSNRCKQNCWNFVYNPG